MKLLLDTHAILWHALDNSQLSARAESVIRDTSHEIFVSAATYWELAIKISIGKLSVEQRFEDFQDACDERFPLLPIAPAHIAQVAKLKFPPDHHDPFDRLMIAQAIVENMSIVSCDVAFDDYAVSRIW